MDEHEIILEDLRNYLKDRGIETSVVQFDGWNIHFQVYVFKYFYSIVDNTIQRSNGEHAISLADPEYREKFYRYLIKKVEEDDRLWRETPMISSI